MTSGIRVRIFSSFRNFSKFQKSGNADFRSNLEVSPTRIMTFWQLLYLPLLSDISSSLMSSNYIVTMVPSDTYKCVACVVEYTVLLCPNLSYSFQLKFVTCVTCVTILKWWNVARFFNMTNSIRIIEEDSPIQDGTAIISTNNKTQICFEFYKKSERKRKVRITIRAGNVVIVSYGRPDFRSAGSSRLLSKTAAD